ncbi:MAG: glycosyltransferase [Acetobacteraceae bacterium]|nr:glycosyltransferase [Acetobacteraceae bacterium]
MKIAVGIPTFGRPDILAATLTELGRQSRPPDSIVVCGASESDYRGCASVLSDVIAITAAQGSSPQRNAILRRADADVVVFFDDDFIPHPSYLAAIEQEMQRDPSIVVATGLVLADGIKGPGLSIDAARKIVAEHTVADGEVRPAFNGYGCNMAVRVAPVRQNGIWFDERLPLYAWQEDVDLSRRLRQFGGIVRIESACGVHLGVKSGRGSGVRLGYSQIANPLYLSRKKQGYPLRRALTHLAKNMAINVLRSLRPEPYVDRRGRLRGNILAFRDLLTGRMEPERVLEL